MRKEVIIAIVLGLTVGLVITYGIYRVQTAITEPPVAELDAEQTEVATAPAETNIAILNPSKGAVLTETETTVTGTTSPEAFVVLFVNDTDYISTADASGNFSFTVPLSEGANVLRAHVLQENGQATAVERVVVVSDLLEEAEAQTATESAPTDEAE